MEVTSATAIPASSMARNSTMKMMKHTKARRAQSMIAAIRRGVKLANIRFSGSPSIVGSSGSLTTFSLFGIATFFFTGFFFIPGEDFLSDGFLPNFILPEGASTFFFFTIFFFGAPSAFFSSVVPVSSIASASEATAPSSSFFSLALSSNPITHSPIRLSSDKA